MDGLLNRPPSRGESIRGRPMRLATELLSLCRGMGHRLEERIVATQLLRSATSVAANYRAVCRARSRREFVAKLGLVIEEADETLFWLEFLSQSGIVPAKRLSPVMRETDELLSILVTSRCTARRALKRK